MLTVTKIFRFEAAHRLPFHQGKCNNLHGHNYKLEVTFKGDLKLNGSDKGMIMDFTDLKEIINEIIIVPLDHSYLNENFTNPTAENMVLSFIDWINDKRLVRLKLWETDDCFAEWVKE